MIHAGQFAFRVTEKTKVASAGGELSAGVGEGSSGDSLVCFLSVESSDETSPEKVIAEAREKILEHYRRVGAQTLWLYPYAHLSSDLASPRFASRLLDEMFAAFEGANGVKSLMRAPFGYYKAFEIQAKGHPLSELALTVKGDGGSGAPGAAPAESKAISAEKKLRSKFFILTPEGEEIDPARFAFREHPVLSRLYSYETSGTRATTDEEPPHVKLMRAHELVDYEPGSDAGNFRWYPKGLLIKSLLEDRVNTLMNQYGAMRVETPIMYDYLHPNLSKYLDRFPARQYVLKSEKKEYFLRFAACFGQYLIQHDMQISYKQLPVRLYELTHYSFRREQSGELAGLRRLRTFTMPDMHTLCRDMAQAREEFRAQFDLSHGWMRDLGLPFATAVRVVRSFYDENVEFVRDLPRRVGGPLLLEVWDDRFFYFVMKFEFNVLDNHDKAAALSTVQVDVENCSRFDIKYVDEKGEKATPLILHASIPGAIDRNLYALLEHQASLMKQGKKGVFPFWLAPTQIRFIPVSDRHVPWCDELSRSMPFRADFDDREMSMGKKIKVAEQEWVPFISVVGDKELESRELSARVRGSEDFHGSQEMLVERMKQLLADKPYRPLNTPRRLSLRPVFVG
jgi:threonyl-tRNA synthetase